MLGPETKIKISLLIKTIKTTRMLPGSWLVVERPIRAKAEKFFNFIVCAPGNNKQPTTNILLNTDNHAILFLKSILKAEKFHFYDFLTIWTDASKCSLNGTYVKVKGIFWLIVNRWSKPSLIALQWGLKGNPMDHLTTLTFISQ